MGNISNTRKYGVHLENKNKYIDSYIFKYSLPTTFMLEISTDCN